MKGEITHLKYSDAAEAYLTKAVLFRNVEVVLVLLFIEVISNYGMNKFNLYLSSFSSNGELLATYRLTIRCIPKIITRSPW